MYFIYIFSFLVCPSLESNQKKSDRAIAKEKGTNHKACSTRQDDPYKVYEHLQLTLEEVCRAYYLSFYRFNWKMVDNMSSFIVFIKFFSLSCRVHVIHQILEILDFFSSCRHFSFHMDLVVCLCWTRIR